jgi:hypothetical protein
MEARYAEHRRATDPSLAPEWQDMLRDANRIKRDLGLPYDAKLAGEDKCEG